MGLNTRLPNLSDNRTGIADYLQKFLTDWLSVPSQQSLRKVLNIKTKRFFKKLQLK